MTEVLQEQMSFCYDAFSSVDRVSLSRPDGAFYLFAHIAGVKNSFDYAVQLLKTTRVSLSPGFGVRQRRRRVLAPVFCIRHVSA